jgi:hypothetical protein
MVRQRQAQPVTTTTPAGVHIGTRAFAVAGTNERHILTWIKTPIAVVWFGLCAAPLKGIVFALILVVTAAITVVSYVAHLPPPGCSARC